MKDVNAAISHETEVLGGCYCKERVIVGTEGERIGVEGSCCEGIRHNVGGDVDEVEDRRISIRHKEIAGGVDAGGSWVTHGNLEWLSNRRQI